MIPFKEEEEDEQFIEMESNEGTQAKDVSKVSAHTAAREETQLLMFAVDLNKDIKPEYTDTLKVLTPIVEHDLNVELLLTLHGGFEFFSEKGLSEKGFTEIKGVYVIHCSQIRLGSVNYRLTGEAVSEEEPVYKQLEALVRVMAMTFYKLKGDEQLYMSGIIREIVGDYNLYLPNVNTVYLTVANEDDSDTIKLTDKYSGQ
jgi:hypothetical protein